jgi:hypothetical protein
MPPERRIATLVAFAHVFEGVAQDDAVDLLNQLITKCLARAEQSGAQERLRTIHDLDAAAIRLNLVCKVVLDPQSDFPPCPVAYMGDVENKTSADWLTAFNGPHEFDNTSRCPKKMSMKKTASVRWQRSTAITDRSVTGDSGSVRVICCLSISTQ